MENTTMLLAGLCRIRQALFLSSGTRLILKVSLFVLCMTLSTSSFLFAKDGPAPPLKESTPSALVADPLQFTVSGKVTNEDGEPLPGVNVLEKGTTNGTTTDVDGAYVITVKDENATLVFSFIGYVIQEIR